MKQSQQFGYHDDETAGYLTLPYGNNAFSMTIMLPHEGKTLNEAVNKLNDPSFNPGSTGISTQVNLQLPRFTIECRYRLEDILPEMGMKLAFTNNADFTGINGEIPLSISRVVHKTFVSVDEEGTEAAAATAVEAGVTSVGPDERIVNFIVDKPFIFMIRENSTGVILFIGAMKKID